MKRFVRIALALPIFLVLAFGQGQNVVAVKVVAPSGPLAAGRAFPLTLEVNIRSPYHINAEQPLEDFLIGTTVTFKPKPGATFKKVKFPPAETRKTDLSENPMAIYEGKVDVTAEVELAADFPGPELVIEGTVGYQACDNQSCLPPADAAFSLKVPVTGGSGAPAQTARGTATPETKAGEKAAAQTPVTAAAGSGAPLAAPAKANPFGGKGLFVMFILVFLGGLALNLTPCIYPLIPITISYFGGQGGGKKGSLVLHSVIYVVGMAATYSVLGSIAAFTGGMFGAALQIPAVLIAIAAVMVLLALSMFNVYELRMPAFLNRFAAGSKKGLFGTFFMGLTCGIIAAPCIGPFVLGLLTYVGDKGNVLLGFSLFFVLALGLGVPFLFLGLFSGSINRIPRSGAWMVWVRTIFGFILIAMAVYFLKSVFPSPLFYSLTLALVMLIAGIYMAWIEPTKTGKKAFVYIRTIFGLIFFALALYIAVTGIQGYIDEELNARVQGLAARGAGVAADAIAWQPYADELVDRAARDSKPVFVDFYADWCIPCKELDKSTFVDPDVVAASRSFVMLKGNLTSTNDPKVKAVTEKFQVRGVPTLVFLAADGKEMTDLRGTGFEKKEVFLPKMLKTLEAGRKK